MVTSCVTSWRIKDVSNNFVPIRWIGIRAFRWIAIRRIIGQNRTLVFGTPEGWNSQIYEKLEWWPISHWKNFDDRFSRFDTIHAWHTRYNINLYYVIELRRRARWPGPLLMYVKVVNEFTTTYEPLLVLGFSVERLIAICCPLQVRGLCCIMYRLIHHVRKKSLHYFRHNVIKSWPILNFFWIGDCLHASTPSQYVTSHQFNSAFHFSGVCKSNTRLQTGVKAGRFICVG